MSEHCIVKINEDLPAHLTPDATSRNRIVRYSLYFLIGTFIIALISLNITINNDIITLISINHNNKRLLFLSQQHIDPTVMITDREQQRRNRQQMIKTCYEPFFNQTKGTLHGLPSNCKEFLEKKCVNDYTGDDSYKLINDGLADSKIDGDIKKLPNNPHNYTRSRAEMINNYILNHQQHFSILYRGQGIDEYIWQYIHEKIHTTKHPLPIRFRRFISTSQTEKAATFFLRRAYQSNAFPVMFQFENVTGADIASVSVKAEKEVLMSPNTTLCATKAVFHAPYTRKIIFGHGLIILMPCNLCRNYPQVGNVKPITLYPDDPQIMPFREERLRADQIAEEKYQREIREKQQREAEEMERRRNEIDWSNFDPAVDSVDSYMKTYQAL